MLSILFWNTRGGAVGSEAEFVSLGHNIDIVILAEEQRPASEIFPSSAGFGSIPYKEFSPIPSDIRFFIRNGAGSMRMVSDIGPRQSIREFTNIRAKSLLIAGVHLPSKLHANPEAQYFVARRFRDALELAENVVQHDRTVVIGDMNMNPFEPGMSAADGLHGIMDKHIATKKHRMIRGTSYKYLYNPMWSRVGDESQGPAGTYYRGADGINSTFWHTFDQALIRPSLIPAYNAGSLQVVSTLGSKNFVTKTKISPSDHLPIILRLDI